MKRSVFLVIVAVGLPILLIFVIHRKLDKASISNGFKRIIYNEKLHVSKVIHMPSNNMYIIGMEDDIIYLRDLDRPTLIYKTDSKLDDINFSSISITKQTRKIRLNMTHMDNTFFVNELDTDTAIIVTYQGKIKKKFRLPSKGLSQSNLISPTSLISREIVLKNQRLERRVVKLDISNPKSIRDTFKLTGSSDQYFSNDGLLRFNNENKSIYYMYFYTGQISCLDTNLNLRYSLKTIDTIKFAKMKLLNSKRTKGTLTGNSITQAQPPKIVNRNFCISGNFIYVLSNLKSDNENIRLFRDNQIVDIYSSMDGGYLKSFYIPKYQEEKVKTIIIKDSNLFVLYKSNFVSYLGLSQLILN